MLNFTVETIAGRLACAFLSIALVPTASQAEAVKLDLEPYELSEIARIDLENTVYRACEGVIESVTTSREKTRGYILAKVRFTPFEQEGGRARFGRVNCYLRDDQWTCAASFEILETCERDRCEEFAVDEAISSDRALEVLAFVRNEVIPQLSRGSRIDFLGESEVTLGITLSDSGQYIVRTTTESGESGIDYVIEPIEGEKGAAAFNLVEVRPWMT